MKKLTLTLAALAFVAFTFTSCKKEYECCWYKDGAKFEAAGACQKITAKKKDVKSVEDTANANTVDKAYTYDCK